MADHLTPQKLFKSLKKINSLYFRLGINQLLREFVSGFSFTIGVRKQTFFIYANNNINISNYGDNDDHDNKNNINDN